MLLPVDASPAILGQSLEEWFSLCIIQISIHYHFNSLVIKFDSWKKGARDFRALEHMTDQWLPLHVCPTEDSLHIKADHYTAGVRAFLLMPQLLRRTVDTVWRDRRDSGQPDYSYVATAPTRPVIAT